MMKIRDCRCGTQPKMEIHTIQETQLKPYKSFWDYLFGKISTVTVDIHYYHVVCPNCGWCCPVDSDEELAVYQWNKWMIELEDELSDSDSDINKMVEQLRTELKKDPCFNGCFK